MMVLYGTIAGTGLAIVRLFVSWCACGGDDKNTDLDRNSPGIRRDGYVVNPGGSLDGWSVIPAEAEDHGGGKYYVDGNRSLYEPKDLVDNGALNATQYLVPDKPPPEHRGQREKKVDSKPVFDDSRGSNDNASNHRSAPQISSGEPVKGTVHRILASDGLDNTVGRIFPASSVTTPGLPVPFLISPKSILQGLPVNPHTDKPVDGQLKETTSSLTLGKPKTKDFRDSRKSVFDAPKLCSTRKSPTKASGVWPLEQKKEGDVTSLSPPIQKAIGAGRFGNQVPALDTDRKSRNLNKAPQAQKTFTRISNDELTKKNILPSTFDFRVSQGPLVNVADKLKGKKGSPKSSNVPGPVGPTPYSPFGKPRHHRLAFSPEIAVIAPGNKKADNIGEQCDAANCIPFDILSSHLNTRQDSVGKASLECKGADLVEVTNSALGKLSPNELFPVPGPLKFTPNISGNSPFGKTRNIGAMHRNTGTRIPGPIEPRGGLPSPMSRTRQISIPRARKINTLPETKSLSFTPGRNFRNPSHFPQQPPVFPRIPGNQPKSTKIFESASEEAADVLRGKRRILQDGTLKKPLVGRVKLVSKMAGKDPGFTYATWAKAGSKRGRGVHNCQEERGCRVCD